MKEIKIYETYDGTHFSHVIDALTYENYNRKADALVEKYLITLDRELEVNEYIQQDMDKVEKLKDGFYDLVLEHRDKFDSMRTLIYECKKGIRDESQMDFIMDESSTPKYIINLWYRIQCIDENGREYHHPYYAKNEKIFGNSKEIHNFVEVKTK